MVAENEKLRGQLKEKYAELKEVNKNVDLNFEDDKRPALEKAEVKVNELEGEVSDLEEELTELEKEETKAKETFNEYRKNYPITNS